MGNKELAREYLKGFIRLQQKLQVVRNELQAWKNSGPVNGVSPEETAAGITKCMVKEKEYLEKLELKKRDLCVMFARLPDVRMNFIMRYRYLDGRSWEEIYRLIDLSRSRVLGLHAEALALIGERLGREKDNADQFTITGIS